MRLTWRDRIPNTEILDQTGSCDMYTMLRSRRLRWTGHVLRMDESRIPKVVLYGELAEGKRSRGRPRLRYRDVVKRDLKSFNICHEDWEHRASDRARWRGDLSKGFKHSVAAYRRMCDLRRDRRRCPDRRTRQN